MPRQLCPLAILGAPAMRGLRAGVCACYAGLCTVHIHAMRRVMCRVMHRARHWARHRVIHKAIYRTLHRTSHGQCYWMPAAYTPVECLTWRLENSQKNVFTAVVMFRLLQKCTSFVR